MQNGGSIEIVKAIPRPLTCHAEIEEGITRDIEGNVKVEKFVALTIFHEVGLLKGFLPPDFAIWLGQRLIEQGQQAKSNLQVVKEIPKDVRGDGQ